MPRKLDDCDYFVSLCLMTENTNPFGHTFIMFSQLDHRQGASAQVEALTSIGFFSRYMPVFGYKPISRGRVKEEPLEDIADKPGMYHKTYPITHQEMAIILASINHDRRLVGNEPPAKGNQPDKPGGPIFNLFKGKNCKAYGLEKLAEIGLDVSSLRGWGLEIPKLTADLLPLKVIKQQHGQDTTYCWDSPLVVHERKIPGQRSHLNNYHQFHLLQQAVNKINLLLTHREAQLNKQGRQIETITKTKEKIQKIKEQLTTIQAYPKKIQPRTINKYRKELSQAVRQCTAALNKQGIELNLVNLLLDTLKEMYYRLRYQLPFFTEVDDHIPNSKDKFVLQQIKIEQQKVNLR